MTDSRVASLAALLRELAPHLETAAFFGLDARWTPEAVAEWLVRRGVTVGSRLGEPSPEGPWEAAYIEHRGAWSIRRRADVDREHEVFAMTADRRKAVAVAGALNRLGVRVGSEETPQ